jgi:hypothetical protein
LDVAEWRPATLMRLALTFVTALALHGVLFLVVIYGFLGMDSYRDPRLPFLFGGALLVFGALAWLITRRWPAVSGVPYGLGVLCAMVFGTLAVLTLSWVLTHPVNPPPPFISHVWYLAGQRNGLLWLTGPTILGAGASALGWRLGRRRGV